MKRQDQPWTQTCGLSPPRAPANTAGGLREVPAL